MLPGEHSRKHANGRAGIFGVKRLPRSFQAVEPFPAMRTRSRLHVDLDPEAPQAFERAAAIGGRGIISYFAGAFGERRQNRVTMRNGFVARKFHNPGDVSARRNSLFAHGAILTCRDLLPAYAARIMNCLMPLALRKLIPPFLVALRPDFQLSQRTRTTRPQFFLSAR